MHSSLTAFALSAASLVVQPLAPGSLAAQSSVLWVDLGTAVVRQPRSTNRGAASLGLGALHRRGALSVDGAAVLTVADDSIAAAQGTLRVALAPARLAWSRTTADVGATTVGLVWPGGAGNRSLSLHQELRASWISASLGGGWGRTSRYRLDSRSAVLDAAITASRGPLSVAASVQRARTDDWQLMEAAGYGLRTQVPAYQVRDLGLSLQWTQGPVTVAASRTSRTGVAETSGRSIGDALGVVWSPRGPVQLIAQHGRQLADLQRGIPQATYTGLAARWRIGAARARAQATTRISESVAWRGGTDTMAEAVLERQDGVNVVVLRVVAPTAATVDVAHSAGDWTPVPLVRDGAVFRARIALPSGAHRLAVRINGGEWRAPKGLVRVTDDFGGAAGVIVVP